MAFMEPIKRSGDKHVLVHIPNRTQFVGARQSLLTKSPYPGTLKTDMESKFSLLQILIGFLLLGFVQVMGNYLLPPPPTNVVTVTGVAQSKEKNQIANFSAGINVVKDNKQDAINEVNQKIADIIEAAKAFGIKAEDIKTQNINVYQAEETYYEDNRQKTRPGQWRVGNTIEVILRDVERAGALADTLTKAGATSVYGPNFSLEDTKEIEKALLADAITDARKKAELIARGSGRKLGKIITVTEGYVSSPPIFMQGGGGGMGGGGPVEPGSATVSKSVTVTFQLQ